MFAIILSCDLFILHVFTKMVFLAGLCISAHITSRCDEDNAQVVLQLEEMHQVGDLLPAIIRKHLISPKLTGFLLYLDAFGEI